MGNEFGDPPKWVREGRTGPGPLAPRYATRKGRRAARKQWHQQSSSSGCVVAAIAFVSPVVAFVGMFGYWLFT